MLGPLYWLGHNWWIYSNPLEFYNGPYSPMSIYRRALAQNMVPYPGDHDWQGGAALTIRQRCGFAPAGPPWRSGSWASRSRLFKRIFWPAFFAALPPVFYVWSMHSGGTPIFVPSLWPFSYYNTRYALAALPLLAIAGGSLVLLGPQRFRPWIAAAHRDCGDCALADPPAAQRLGHLERIASQLRHAPRLDQSGRVFARRLLSSLARAS